MFKRGFLGLALAALVLAAPARAASTPGPMPVEVQAHISVKSPLAFLQNLDNYVSAASKGTASQIPPGLLSMMAQFYLPIPLDTWDSDGEVHVVVLRSETPDDLNVVGVFGASGLDALVESLEERDWIAGDGGEDESVRPVVVPNGRAMVLVDLGDGRVAIGNDAASVRRALNGWTPSHAAPAADVVANIAMGGNRDLLTSVLTRRLDEEKESLVQAIADAGFKPAVADGIIRTVEKYLPFLVNEVAGVKNIVMEMGFDGDRLVSDMAVLPGVGTLLSEIAGSLTNGKNIDLAVARRIPPGALSVAASAGLADILPNAKNRIVKWTAAFYGGVLPDFREKAAAFAADIMDSGPGQAAVGNYVNGMKQYNVTVNMMKDPEKALGAFTGALETFNDIWAAAVDNPALGLKLAGALRGMGEAVYYRYQPVFTDRARFQELLDRLARERGDLGFDAAAMENTRFFFASLDDCIVSASGELTDEEFVRRLAEIQTPSENPPIASNAAKSLLPGLPNTQASAGIVDAGGLFDLYAAQQIRVAPSLYGEEAAARFAEKALPFLADRKTGGEIMTFGMGAEKGWLNGRCIVPAGAVGQIVRDAEQFDRLQKTVPAVDDPVQTPDEHEDDLLEEEDSDEGDSEAA